jgi:hypothetical protein
VNLCHWRPPPRRLMYIFYCPVFSKEKR